ncbi:MAG: hypothetical protein ACAI25_11720, partial [Planctomycetota bacterium]
AGVPAARFLKIGTYEGRDAAIQRRYEISNKDERFNDFDTQLEYLNERTIADAEKIITGLEAHPEIEFVDFQVLVGKDGRLVVNDPFPTELVPPKPPGWDPIEEFGFDDAEMTPREQLEILIHQARNVIEVRKLMTKLKSMKGADDPELKELFARRQVGLPGVPEFNEEQVRSALVKYLQMEPTTDQAREVARAIKEGKIALVHKWTYKSEPVPNELRINPSNYFVTLASQLVFEGAKRLFSLGGILGLQAEVLAEAHRLWFLKEKGAPDGIERDEVHKRASELTLDADELVRVVERTRKLSATDAERVELAKDARTILRGQPSRTAGMSGLLEERTREGVKPSERARGR